MSNNFNTLEQCQCTGLRSFFRADDGRGKAHNDELDLEVRNAHIICVRKDQFSGYETNIDSTKPNRTALLSHSCESERGLEGNLRA